MGEFIWLENNPKNNCVAAQMLSWPVGEDSRGRTVHCSAGYSSFSGIGADLTCTDTLLVFPAEYINSGLFGLLLLIRMADDVLTFEFGHSFVIT